MAIEKKNETAPVVDDESPVPSQVPSEGQDGGRTDGSERGPTRTSKRDEDRGERTGDRGARRVKADVEEDGKRDDPRAGHGDDDASDDEDGKREIKVDDGAELTSAVERAAPDVPTLPIALPVFGAPPPAAPPPAATSTLAPRSEPILKSVNSTDATIGAPLPVRAYLRRQELEALLEHTEDVRTRQDIELALSSLAGLLTGDTEHLSAPTAAALNRWLEGAKHLGEMAPTAPARRAS